ncbi:MAG: TRAP transporter TatT component family protein [Gammaproteobacteria bacterium]|jgi:hypothetical protein|nr:TRAP transporter TatT component family protein [Gammaproteobacteria bacterium]
MLSRTYQSLRAVAPAALMLSIAALLSGCGAIVARVSGGLADNLSAAILNQQDPELVREALPAYLLLLDSLIAGAPDNRATLAAGAQLYAAYGAGLVTDAERAKTLTDQARDYGRRALCAAQAKACGLEKLDYAGYERVIMDIDAAAVDELYAYSISSLAHIRAHSDDFGALAQLPKVEAALTRVMALEPGDLAASTCMYLGILNTLRPAALGGKPEVGRDWFERGIAVSAGKDLSIKVEYARGYARLVYDRELHDRLLNEVLAAEVEQTDLTLFNKLAQSEAVLLLESADEYF